MQLSEGVDGLQITGVPLVRLNVKRDGKHTLGNPQIIPDLKIPSRSFLASRRRSSWVSRFLVANL